VAVDRREAGNEIERGGEVSRLLGRLGAAIVRQPFERRRPLEGAKPPPGGLKHNVPDDPAADAPSDEGMPCDDFAVMGVDDEGHRDEAPVSARDVEPVRTPAQVRAHDDDFASVDIAGPAARVPGEQHAVLGHDWKTRWWLTDGLPALASSLFARTGMRQ
jgi:hypothetical protein